MTRLPVRGRVRRADHGLPRVRRAAPPGRSAERAPAGADRCARCRYRAGSGLPRGWACSRGRWRASRRRRCGRCSSCCRPAPARATAAGAHPGRGARRARVALLAGCAQQVLAPGDRLGDARVLARNGVEVIVPRGQGCCGALAMHGGAQAQARRFARRTIAAFAGDFDAIVTNAAGCGSGMREYPLLLAGEPDEAEARAFAERVVDVSAFLDDLGLRGRRPRPSRSGRVPRRLPPVPCAGRPGGAPATARRGRARGRDAGRGRDLLRLGRDLQPRAARDRGGARPSARRSDLLATEPDLIAAGNIGCLTQIRTHLAPVARCRDAAHGRDPRPRLYRRAVCVQRHRNAA